jgi:hypothetical protein
VAPLARPARLSAGDALVRRFRGEYEVDEWGLDEDLVRALIPLARARWAIETVGANRLPLGGRALLVYSRRGFSEPAILSSALHRATSRVVRHPGIVDRAPIGPLVRRLGGVVGRSDEIAGLLRAGGVVAVPLRREVLSRRAAGPAPADRLERALALEVPVLPVAVVGFEAGRRWQVAIGPAITVSPARAPLAARDLAERARDSVQNLLDDHVGSRWPFA